VFAWFLDYERLFTLTPLTTGLNIVDSAFSVFWEPTLPYSYIAESEPAYS